jgi:hypothetical protein
VRGDRRVQAIQARALACCSSHLIILPQFDGHCGSARRVIEGLTDFIYGKGVHLSILIMLTTLIRYKCSRYTARAYKEHNYTVQYVVFYSLARMYPYLYLTTTGSRAAARRSARGRADLPRASRTSSVDALSPIRAVSARNIFSTVKPARVSDCSFPLN